MPGSIIKRSNRFMIDGLVVKDPFEEGFYF